MACGISRISGLARPCTTERLATVVPRLLAGAIAASIVYGEVRILTDSVWLAWLMHTIGAAFIGNLNGLFIVSSGTEFLIAPVLEGGLMSVLFTLVGVGICRLRKRRTTA